MQENRIAAPRLAMRYNRGLKRQILTTYVFYVAYFLIKPQMVYLMFCTFADAFNQFLWEFPARMIKRFIMRI